MMKFYTFSRLTSGIVIKCFNQMIMSLSLLFFYMLYVLHFECFNVFLCALSLHRHIHIRDTLSSGSGILMAVGFKVHSAAAVAALVPGIESLLRYQGEKKH